MSKPVKTHDESALELGKLYANLGDFKQSLQKLVLASELYLKEKNFSKYLECQNSMLRIYANRDDQDMINATKERIQDLVLKEGFELNARTFYTLGICAVYKEQFELALDYFQKSLATALASDKKEDMCYAIFGIATTYGKLGRYNEALKEIYNLQVFFEVLDVPDLKAFTKVLNANILRKLGKFEQALETFWTCYDELRQNQNMYLFFSVLAFIGHTYKEMGDMDMARMYLQLAKRSIDPVNLKHLYDSVENALVELGVPTTTEFDLVIDSKENSVVEKKKGKIDFKSQFILLDLLHLFVRNAGQVFSKEDLANKIWGQDYNPSIHDNKIYVTIKRLRELIEPDPEKPRYVFRAKNGYYLNKTVKVLIS